MAKPSLLAGLLFVLCVAGCPATDSTTPDPNDPNSTALPAWLDGDWDALATSLTDAVSGSLTITSGRVTSWRGSSGLMSIMDNPIATTTATGVHVSVTVTSATSGFMSISMELSRVTDDQLAGSITTITLTSTPFFGVVTLTRT
jgi:hypothetical protein